MTTNKKYKRNGDAGTGRVLALLGPEGTYSHVAAKKYADKNRKTKYQLTFFPTISDAIAAVAEGRAAEAVLPFENSIHGTVLETLDGIFERDLMVKQELVLDIHHSVAALHKKMAPSGVKTVYSHPQALAQCRRYIRKHFPHAALVPTASTSGGQKKISDEKIQDAMAIGPAFAAKMNGLHIIDQDIEDETNNQTMFVAVSKADAVTWKKSNMKTTLFAVSIRKNREGILHDILGVFRVKNINLSKVESRPSGKKLGLYIFYIKADIAGNDRRVPHVQRELAKFNVAVKKLSA